MRHVASAVALLLRAAANSLLTLLGRLGNEPVRAYRPEERADPVCGVFVSGCKVAPYQPKLSLQTGS
jgi:hypothetical protein